jgi:hypothetical protein
MIRRLGEIAYSIRMSNGFIGLPDVSLGSVNWKLTPGIKSSEEGAFLA